MKNRKKANYATIDESGMDYRKISKELQKFGYDIGHSSVRNDILKSMKKIAKILSRRYNMSLSDDQLDQLAKDPNFQQSVGDILSDLMKKK